MDEFQITFERLRVDDAEELTRFYNALSPSSKRMFRPLGAETTVDVCIGIANANREGAASKFDIVAKRGAAIVGWAFLWSMDTAEPTFGLAVADEHQGRGVGSRLMDYVMAVARAEGKERVNLTVVKGNSRALGLYERRGFAKGGEFIGDDGLPYYRMSCELVPAHQGKPR